MNDVFFIDMNLVDIRIIIRNLKTIAPKSFTKNLHGGTRLGRIQLQGFSTLSSLGPI